MCANTGAQRCKWCGTELAANAADFCATCQAPQTGLAKLMYAANFIAKNFAIPLMIGVVTLLLTTRQQEAALVVSNRQKLAEALSDVGKVQADSRLAYTQIALMALPNGRTVPAKDLKDAATRLDVAISSFGAKIGVFDEFVRRTKYYGAIERHKASPLQKAWDECFVSPYWGVYKQPGYLQVIEGELTKCDEAACPKMVAQEIKRIHDEFYKGYCHDLREPTGEKVEQLELKWFNREFKRISIQAREGGPIYVLGEE
jgi:hypothetical protein